MEQRKNPRRHCLVSHARTRLDDMPLQQPEQLLGIEPSMHCEAPGSEQHVGIQLSLSCREKANRGRITSGTGGGGISSAFSRAPAAFGAGCAVLPAA